MVFLAFMTLVMKKMAPHEFLLPINHKKVEKIMKIWTFPPLVLVWPSKKILAFFQFFWPSDILNIQNHSNLSYFEAIWPLKQFLLKISQSGSVCETYLI